MKELIIQVEGSTCYAELRVAGKAIASTRMEVHEGVSWDVLQSAVFCNLRLDTHTQPGMPTVGEETSEVRGTDGRVYERVFGSRWWIPVACGGSGAPGYGWGVLLPSPIHQETCCGFRDKAAALKAAQVLRTNAIEIPSLPGASYEAFQMGQVWAFADMHGEIHTGFTTPQEARACAVKTETAHWNTSAAAVDSPPPKP